MKHARDTRPNSGVAKSKDQTDRELPDLLTEAGLRPGRGIDDWLDWLIKRGEAGQ